MNNHQWFKIQCIWLIAIAILVPVPSAHTYDGTEVSILFAQIRSGNKKVRDLAASELWSVSNESITDALPILKGALNDKDNYVRQIAAAAIERVNPNVAVDAVPALRNALKDSDPLVRSLAASSLGMIGRGAVSEAVQALKDGLNDKSPSVRRSATKALGQIGQPASEAVNNLIETAKDSNQLIRRAAVAALGEIIRGAPTATPKSLAALRNSLEDEETLVRISAANAIGRIGLLAEPLILGLQETLKDNQESVRRAGVNALGQLAHSGIEEARRVLEKELSAPRSDVRLFTIEVFGRMGLSTQKLAALFLEVLSDPEPKMRRAAAIALGNVKPAEPEVISALEKGLTDQDKSVREASVRSLSSTGSISMETSPKVYPLLRDSSTEVRRAAAIALQNVRPASPGTILALRETLGDDNGLVRQAAVWALVSLGSTPPDAVPTLQLMLRDPETEIRRGAVVALGRIGQGAVDTVSSLTDLLRDPNQQVRQDVVVALGNIGPSATVAIHHLTDVMMDHRENSNVRQAAADSLGKIGRIAKESLPSIREAMRDDNESISSAAARALVKIGSAEEIVPTLIDDVKSQSRSMRRAALTALTAMGPDAKDAVPVLVETLHNQQASATSQEHFGSMAAIALGEIGIAARSALPELIKGLDEPATRYGAVKALIKISRSLADTGEVEVIPSLQIAHDKLLRFEGIDKDDYKDDLSTMKLVLDNLTGQRWSNWRNLLLSEYRNFTVPLIFILGLLAAYGLIYWRRPLVLLHLEDFLSRLSSTGSFEKVFNMALFLIGFFCYRQRVLDVWLGEHMCVAKEEFLKRNTVKDRTVHFSLPVLCDGKIVTNFSPEHIQSSFKGGQGCVLILGEGGAGKTSLACQIAQWAMAGRLCDHQMIPVLLEEELEDSTSPNPVQLDEVVRGQLRNLLRLEEPIRKEFLRQLLIKKRVLVIVDRLSEMNSASRAKVNPSAPDFPFNALVVTSRINEDLEGASKIVVRPRRLDGVGLAHFVEQYLQEQKKQDLLLGEEILEESTRLHKIVGKRNITVLLAKLYMDLIIARKEANVDDRSPKTVPELMVYYLNLINNKAVEVELNDVAVQRFAKIVAWECLRQSFAPTQAARDVVLHALPNNVNPERVLRYLEDKLQLITTVGPEKKHIKFTLDPLAEYLAALHLVEQYDKDETQWREFLQKADSISESGRQINEFLSAVNDCFSAKCTEWQLPQFVPQELEKRLAVESVAETTYSE